MKKSIAFMILFLFVAVGICQAEVYNWGETDTNPLLKYVFDATSGHNHDGTNSRTVTIASPYGSLNGAAGVTGVANGIEFEGATANAYETTLSVTDPTADRTVTIADASGAVMLSSLATNGPDVANSVTGASNKLEFEGATADAYETWITPIDATADRTITLPNDSGTVMLSSLATNAADAANSVTGASNAIVFEGATADTFETSVVATDPTADRTITLPNRTGMVRVSTSVALTAGTTVTLNPALASVFTDTPTDNENQTINASSAGTGGEMITIVFTAVGTADEVITFGTNMHSVGTLTVDTTAARYWAVSFVSDGAAWFEIARTAVQS